MNDETRLMNTLVALASFPIHEDTHPQEFADDVERRPMVAGIDSARGSPADARDHDCTRFDRPVLVSHR
jgi:hypothetical protein